MVCGRAGPSRSWGRYMSPRQIAVPLVRGFWDVEIEADALAQFESVCARRGLTREQAVREAITWFTARAALWELRTRSYRAARITRQAETFDPIGALLAEPLERPR